MCLMTGRSNRTGTDATTISRVVAPPSPSRPFPSTDLAFFVPSSTSSSTCSKVGLPSLGLPTKLSRTIRTEMASPWY
jgi:hypothetical protein